MMITVKHIVKTKNLLTKDTLLRQRICCYTEDTKTATRKRLLKWNLKGLTQLRARIYPFLLLFCDTSGSRWSVKQFQRYPLLRIRRMYFSRWNGWIQSIWWVRRCTPICRRRTITGDYERDSFETHLLKCVIPKNDFFSLGARKTVISVLSDK